MIQPRNWYAVYTRPRWEKKVAELLTKKNIENYCPLNKVRKQWADRSKIIYEPLFTSYLFVNIPTTDLIHTKETDGVLNFVFWQGKPAVIKDEEIKVIKRFLQEYENVSIERASISPNDKVRVMNGALMMREGEVLEVRHKTVKILIPSIGFSLVAEVDRENIEKLISIIV